MISILVKTQELESKIKMIKSNVIPFVNNKENNTLEELKEVDALLSEQEMLTEDLIQLALRKLSELSLQKKENTKLKLKA